MSDLLAIGRSGVLAYRDALGVVGENVVNADTEGYARRQVALKEQTGAIGPNLLYRNTVSLNGVQSATIQRTWDQFRAANAWSASADSSRADVRAQWLGTIERTLDDSDAGLGVKLTAVFAAGSALAANPGDVPLRQRMLSAINDAARALGRTADTLGKVSDTMAAKADTMVADVNAALQTLVKLNMALRTSPPGTAGRAQLEDQRDTMINTISANLAVDVSIHGSGAVSLKLNDHGGPQLLSASDVAVPAIGLQRAADGRLSVTMTAQGESTIVPATSGALAGIVDVSVTLADRRRQVDELARDLVTTINTWQAQGRVPSGAQGQDLLEGASAATLRLLTDDPAAVAAASATSENGNLLALEDLRGSTGIEARWRNLSSDHALLVASAKTQASAAAAQRDSAFSAMDEVSGVDLDAEAASLIRYQQAYSASAKIIQAARDTLRAILDIV